MSRKKTLLFFTVTIASIVLFSVTGTWAACPDSVDPDFEWFECNKYRVEFVDVVVGPCSTGGGTCTSLTTSLLRKIGSKTLSHTALLQRANIPIVSVKCADPTCTAVKKDAGRGDDSTGFGMYQTVHDTWLLTWDGTGPAIDTPAKITVEARGADWIAGDPLDQLHKVGNKFTDQVFGAVKALDEPCEPPPPIGAKAPDQCVVLLNGTEPQNTAGETWAVAFNTDEFNVPIPGSFFFHESLDCTDTDPSPGTPSYEPDTVYSTGGPGQPNVSYTVTISSPACFELYIGNGMWIRFGC